MSSALDTTYSPYLGGDAMAVNSTASRKVGKPANGANISAPKWSRPRRMESSSSIPISVIVSSPCPQPPNVCDHRVRTVDLPFHFALASRTSAHHIVMLHCAVQTLSIDRFIPRGNRAKECCSTHCCGRTTYEKTNQRNLAGPAYGNNEVYKQINARAHDPPNG